jgi:hypothetical protein
MIVYVHIAREALWIIKSAPYGRALNLFLMLLPGVEPGFPPFSVLSKKL